jgi:hypothetical protein
MNATERQAIRAHHVAIVAYCHCCESICRECSAEYPCDAIRLLDALDEADKQLKCEHTEYDICKCDAPDCYTHDKKYLYCPKCKAKL